jgi:hypothetical protein
MLNLILLQRQLSFCMATTIPLSVPENLLTEVKVTARLTHLSIHEVFLRSVKLAKPALRQSARVVQPKRLSLSIK